MTTYNADYFFIRKPKEREDILSLTPDDNTENRHYSYEQEDEGSPPLVFFNGAKDFQQGKGITTAQPSNVLFDGVDIAVTTEIRRELLKLTIPDMYTHPAIYIHDDGEWHENYWYLTFEKPFDCWDKDKSDYDPEPGGFGSFIYYEVSHFYLNDELLDSIPLDKRLLFKMGNTSDPFITCHKSIKHLFECEGSELIAVSDW